MVENTRAVVIHSFSYSDSSLIVKAYTEKFGYVSYILKGYKKQKKNKILLHPLALVEFSANHKNADNLVFARSVNTFLALKSIPLDPVKSGISIFLAEWLSHTVRIGEGEPDFFRWLEQAISALDLMEKPANFHLWFLLNLCRFLGFYPQGNQSGAKQLFDLNEGAFTDNPHKTNALSVEESYLLDKFIQTELQNIDTIEINYNMRRKLLRSFHHYFQIHLNYEFELKSFDILMLIFND